MSSELESTTSVLDAASANSAVKSASTGSVDATLDRAGDRCEDQSVRSKGATSGGYCAL